MSASAKININTADVETLATLPGVAASLAKRIIEYRENVHPFEEVIELTAVPGVSERMVRKFEDLVTVGDSDSSIDEIEEESEDAMAEVVYSVGNGATTSGAESSVEEDENIAEESVESAAVPSLPVVEEEETWPAPEEPVAEFPAVVEAEMVEEESDYVAPAVVTEEPLDEAEDVVEEAVPVTLLTDEEDTAREETAEEIQESKEVIENNMEDKVEEIPTPRPVFETTPPPPPSTRPVPVTTAPQPASSGFSWLGVLLGAILGAILALAAVFALGFARVGYVDQQISNLASRADVETLNTTVNTLTSSIDAVSGDLANSRQGLDDLNNKLDETNTQIDSANVRIDELTGSQRTLSTAVTTAQGDIVNLQESEAEMTGRIDEVAESAETFDNFLINLRDLLNTLDAPAEGATPEADTLGQATPTPPAENEAPAGGEMSEPTMNILETAAADGNFTTLLTLVDEAGLTEALAEEGPFTLFAPTDSVFEDLPPGALDALSQDPDLLLSILTYHVADSELMAEELVDLTAVSTLSGENITITVTDDGVLLDNAKIMTSNIGATNGVIHVIDQLLIPPSLFGEENTESDTPVEEATPTPTPAAEEGTPTPTGEAEEGEPTPIPVTPTPTP